MSEPTIKVFVVDDDPMARMFAIDPISSLGVSIREFENGDACLTAFEEQPDIVVLDIEMPGHDGIAVCQSIRAEHGDKAQIVFASSHDDLDTRLKAYDAGGNDYIVKPYAPEELARKVEVAMRTLENRRTADGQAQYAQQVAFTAMQSMGEMGVTQEFLRASFGCGEAHELAHVLCKALEQYGVKGLFELRDGDDCQSYSTRGACSELEVSILGHARGLDRIFQYRDRIVINFPHVTLLVPNLPRDDAERAGRLRDHLAVLAEGVESRFVAIQSEARRLVQANVVRTAVADMTSVLEDIELNQEGNRLQLINLAHDQLGELARVFVGLGLSERQEDALTAVTQEGIDKISRLQDTSNALSRRLREVTARLKAVVSENA